MRPTDTNPLQVMLICWASGLTLYRSGDRIGIERQEGWPAPPPELIEAVRHNKAALLRIFRQQRSAA
jgi:hypothetical protein